jgi:hypothetical protein
MDEQLLKMEERQKALMAKNDNAPLPDSCSNGLPSPSNFLLPLGRAWQLIYDVRCSSNG